MPMYNPRRASNFSHNSPLITPHSSRRQSDVTHGFLLFYLRIYFFLLKYINIEKIVDR